MQELKTYLKYNKFSKHLSKIEQQLKGKNIIVYGAGKLFQTIVDNYDLSNLNIIGICDAKYTSVDNGELYLGYPKMTRSCLDLYKYDYILIATKNYIQCKHDLPRKINRNKVIPFIPKFVWFDYIKSTIRNYKYLTLLNKTFEIPFTAAEKVLNYLEAENPQINTNLYSTRNLYTYMADIAARSSAQYIIDNMFKVNSFNDRFKLLTFALQNVHIDGMYMEFGVYKGTSINYIAKQNTNKIVYGFDSFEGLPETWSQRYKKGHFKLPVLPKVNSNVELIKGWFDKTILEFKDIHKNFKAAFIHVDCDLYSSTQTIFGLLKSNIVPGTVIVFDEYFNYPGWEKNEYKAFQDFIKDTGYKYEYLGYVFDSTQVAVKII